MLASNYNITLDRTADYQLIITIKDKSGDNVDLSDATFYSQIIDTRSKRNMVSFDINKSQATSGAIVMSLSELQTKQLLSNVQYSYDLFMQRPSGSEVDTKRLIYGSVTARQEYSNPT